MPLISVIIPTYNEAENIIPLLKKVSKSISSINKKFEIIVVDDNSPDKTGEIVRKYAKKNSFVNVIIRTQDRGLGKSIGEGIKMAHGDIIIGMDADFNHDPKVIPALIKGLEKKDLVVASRFIKGGGMQDKKRFVFTLLFNKFCEIIGFPKTDNTSGFYCVRKKTLDKLGIDDVYYGYGDYHLRLVYFIKKLRYSIGQVPSYYQERYSGQSKSKIVEMAINYTKEALRLAVFHKL